MVQFKPGLLILSTQPRFDTEAGRGGGDSVMAYCQLSIDPLPHSCTFLSPLQYYHE